MKKYTLYLVIFSLLMSVLSLIKTSKGGAEIYPFAVWKLFTRPTGGSGSLTFYKIYGVKNGDTIRIANEDTELLDANAQFSILKTSGEELEKQENTVQNKEKLLTLIEATNPNYDHYFLFSESFNPALLGSKNFTYTKKQIAQLK